MRLLIFSNIYISLAAAALAVQAYYLLGAREFLWRAPDWWGPALLIFFATLGVYNLDRLLSASHEDAAALSARHRWIHARQPGLWGLVYFSIFAGAATLIFVPMRVLAALVPLGVIALAYSVPLLGKRFSRAPNSEKTRRRLKDIPGLKIFLIALVWAAVSVLLPALHAGVPLGSEDVALTFLARMVFIFAITLPFDIRDMRGDARAGIRTLPMVLGPARTRLVALALMLVFSALVLIHYGARLDGPTLPLLMSAVFTGAALVFCAKPRHEFYYVGLLDGTLLLQPLLVILYLERAGLGLIAP